MREIKFRYWTTLSKFTTFTVQYLPDMQNLIPFFLYDYEKLNNCILQKYTGIKDINGSEIYEGDIFGNWIGENNGKDVIDAGSETEV